MRNMAKMIAVFRSFVFLAMIFDGIGGQLIAEIVFFVVAVAFHFDPGDLMGVVLFDQDFPEVAVEDRLLPAVFPPVFLPAHDPFLQESVYQIGTVTVKLYYAWLFEHG